MGLHGRVDNKESRIEIYQVVRVDVVETDVVRRRCRVVIMTKKLTAKQ